MGPRRSAIVLVGPIVLLQALAVVRPPSESPAVVVAVQVSQGLWILLHWYLGRRGVVGLLPTGITPILLVGAVLRLLPLLHPPGFSDDIHRYLWEGRVVWSGFDPYDLAPASPTLASIAATAPEWSAVGHRDLPAIYPPLALFSFATLHAFGVGEIGFRWFFVVVDLLLVMVIRSGPGTSAEGAAWPHLAWIYALHPLATWEGGGNGHYEPLALLPMLLGFRFAMAAQPLRAGFVGGMAWSLKYIGGGVAILPLLRPAVPLRAVLAAGFVLATVALAFVVPFLLDGTAPTGSLGTYAMHWQHNASVFVVLQALFGNGARLAVPVLLLVCGFWSLRALRRGVPPARVALDLMLALLLLSPVVHPWYALWPLVLLPWAAGARLSSATAFVAPRLLFFALVPLAGLVHTVSTRWTQWEPPSWVPWVEYGLPALVLALYAVRAPLKAPPSSSP